MQDQVLNVAIAMLVAFFLVAVIASSIVEAISTALANDSIFSKAFAERLSPPGTVQ